MAVERLEKGKGITRGRGVAGVSFGFWAGLFSNHYEELWRHQLRHLFPHGPIMRKNLTQRMRLLQRFRNRVAHHDCLLSARRATTGRLLERRLLVRLIVASERRVLLEAWPRRIHSLAAE